MRHAQGPAARRRVAGMVVAACGALVLGTFSPAHADDHPAPSADDVRAAKQKAQEKASQVGEIKARLVAASQRVDALAVEAAKAAEKYNGVRYELARAKKEARATARREKAAAKDVEKQRRRVANLALQGVQQGTGLNRMSALFESAGPAQLLQQSSAYDSTSDAVQAALDAYASKRSVYELLVDKTRQAVDKQRELAAQAEEAKSAAQAAVAASQDAVDGIAQRKRHLVKQLARAQGISYDLAQQRQDELERQAALREKREQEARAARAAREAAEARAAQERAAKRRAARKAARKEAARKEEAQQEAAAQSESGSGGGHAKHRDHKNHSDRKHHSHHSHHSNPAPDPAPPSPSGGASAAIAFARAQIGEPYVWAAAGPSSWDCSGLTMKAWAAGGRYLPHYSGAQYASSTPISMSQIQRGDLLFWSNGGPSSIYHVALYIGGGQMIEAPRPGRNVELVSIYSWTYPDLAARP